MNRAEKKRRREKSATVHSIDRARSKKSKLVPWADLAGSGAEITVQQLAIRGEPMPDRAGIAWGVAELPGIVLDGEQCRRLGERLLSVAEAMARPGIAEAIAEEPGDG